MNKTLLVSLLSAAGTLIIAIATHGEQLLAALQGMPILLARWTEPSMIGAWSLLAGLLIPAGVWLMLDRLLPSCRQHPRRRLVLVEGLTALSAIAIVFLLLPTLPGLLLGTFGAVFAPLLARLLKPLTVTTLEVDR